MTSTEIVRGILDQHGLGITGEALQLLQDAYDNGTEELVKRATWFGKHCNREVRILSKLT